MKKLCTSLFLFAAIAFKAQTICNSSGNLMIYTNYDGGTLTINVDQNIPNLKIGICSYEGVIVNLTGAFLSNVVGVRYAGYNGSNNHCGSSINTIINGVSSGTSIAILPAVTLSNPNGYSSMVCGSSCDNGTNQGGCNTPDQVEAYFLNFFSGSTLYGHKIQYGCWTGTQSLTIGGNCCPPLPVYPGVVAASQTICAGTSPGTLSSNQSATISVGTIGYQWQSSTTSPSSGFSSILGAIASTYAPGVLNQTTYFRRAASTATNNIAYSNALTVIVLPVPVVNILIPTPLCFGALNTLTATGSGTNYAWSSGGSSTSTIVITPTISAAMSVTCFLANGCSSTGSVMVLVTPIPTIPIIQPPPVCTGATATLSAGGGISYLWQPGNLSGQSVTVAATTSQIFTVTIISSNGCPQTKTLALTVNPVPMINAVSNATVCSNSTLALTVSGASSYSWMPGSLVGSSVTISGTVSAVYTVTGQDANSCKNTATISVTSLPAPSISITVNRPKICIGEKATLTPSGGIDYVLMNTATSINGGSIAVTPTTTTVYTIGGGNLNGCVSYAVKTVTVSACTGIETLDPAEQSGISIYPNPNSGEFFISAKVPVSLDIIDNAGRQVKHIELNDKNGYKAEVTNLSPGIYFVVSGSGTINFKQKIVVTK